ncbi:alpha-(1,6)-fucosyltransferase-like isoform X3 [Clavelina lepadiformis]|uniref:alpha-(1,6)-fucosyltransferase-like isoform X3 n=1 Tax=Clavelina lepadiformis TaxID=159417 RepID=UPI00404371AA
MVKKNLKLFLVISLSFNVTLLYSVVKFPNGLQERPQSSWSRTFQIPEPRNCNDHQASLSVGINKTSTKNQFTLVDARSLIKRAYLEAIEVNEFVRKYFRKDMDLTKKAALEEDYLTNYLPFNDLTRKMKFLVDVIHNESQKDLSDLVNEVQKRIHKLQNPSDCKTAKKLVCKFPYYGFGSQHHHIGNCLLAALGTNRVMLVDYSSVRYPGIQKVFLPLSDTCSMEDLPKQVDEWKGELQENFEHIQVVKLDLTHEGSANTRFKGLTIPKFLEEKVEFLHDDPNMWWIGQIMGYLLRPRPWISFRVQLIKRKLNLNHPYVSIHVRRTDKLKNDARKFEIEEYMTLYLQDPVVAWYDSQVGNACNYTRRVYVASDDLASVIPDARNKYPNYDFVYNAVDDKKLLKDMKQTVESRQTEDELFALACDLMILSQSDYFVGTYSSNIGRLVTQLMHSSSDATFRSRSIDHRMHYHRGLPLTYRAVEDFSGGKGELSFSAGETIVLRSFVEFPSYKGFGRNEAGHEGTFPMYKVEQTLTLVQYLALNDTF